MKPPMANSDLKAILPEIKERKHGDSIDTNDVSTSLTKKEQQ